MTDATWRARAREALRRGPGCPDAERLRVWSETGRDAGASADPSWLATDAHVRQCARCGLEAESLKSFFAPATESASGPARAATEEIRDLLRRTLAAGHGARLALASRPSPARGRVRLWERLRGRPWIPAFQMALLVGIGLALLVPLLRQSHAPEIPTLDSSRGVLRGDPRPRLRAPLGEQPSIPRRFEWEADETPTGGWSFRLERVDGSSIWSAETSERQVELPGEVAGALHPGSRYVWRVQASQGPSPAATASFWIVP